MPTTLDARTLYLKPADKAEVVAQQQASDESLVLAVMRREQAALEQLLQRHSSWALGFAERLTGSRENAEEVVQTAFMRVWDKAERWEARARFTTWFYRILHNLCIDRMRRERSGFDTLNEDLVDSAPSVEDSLDRERSDARVRHALANLPQRQRVALVLSHYQGCSQREAAAIMSIGESALESLLVRARSTLRRQLQRELH